MDEEDERRRRRELARYLFTQATAAEFVGIKVESLTALMDAAPFECAAWLANGAPPEILAQLTSTDINAWLANDPEGWQVLIQNPDLIRSFKHLSAEVSLAEPVRLLEGAIGMQLLFQGPIRWQLASKFKDLYGRSLWIEDQELLKAVGRAFASIIRPSVSTTQPSELSNYIGFEVEPNNARSLCVEIRSQPFRSLEPFQVFLKNYQKLIRAWEAKGCLWPGYYVNFHLHYGLSVEQYDFWHAGATLSKTLEFICSAGLIQLPIGRIIERDMSLELEENRSRRRQEYRYDRFGLQKRSQVIASRTDLACLLAEIRFLSKTLAAKTTEPLEWAAGKIRRKLQKYFDGRMLRTQVLELVAKEPDLEYAHYLSDLFPDLSTTWLKEEILEPALKGFNI